MNTVKMHGEVAFVQVTQIPTGASIARNLKTVSDGRVIVGESETTGNHHVIEAAPSKIEFYELNGQMYMRVKEDVTVGCVHKDRHDDMVIEPGIYKHKIQKEYDYFKQEKINVQD